MAVISLGEPRKTQPTGFKRALNFPELRVMVFSTGHDRLLVPERAESRGACRVGAGRREIPRHSWDVAVCVEYWSRTLTAGSQLCKECIHTSRNLAKRVLGWEYGIEIERTRLRLHSAAQRPASSSDPLLSHTGTCPQGAGVSHGQVVIPPSPASGGHRHV